MATNNIKILFWIQPSKQNKKGEAPIYLRMSFNGQRKNISTGYFISPTRWDSAKGAIKGRKDETTHINSYILQTRAKMMELFNEMLIQRDINLDLLIDRFLGRDIHNMTLMELVNYHNNDFRSRIGIDYAFSTFEKYDILRKKLEAFLAYKYSKKDVRLRDLSHKFMMDFDFYLKEHDKNEHNTCVKYHQNLKKIINVGVLNHWIKDNPFKLFKTCYKDVDRVYLTQYELNIIESKSFQLERLNLVKDLFLFQCYTGLAYTDMAKLTFGSVAPGIDGNKWIITRRQKTDVRAAIPLLPKAEEIIRKYNKGEANLNSSLFPFYSIQKFNSYLHDIADSCGINKNLTSHVGRRTFATTITLANGIGLETISKMLGHSSTRITAQYAVVTDQKISTDMLLLRKKLTAD